MEQISMSKYVIVAAAFKLNISFFKFSHNCWFLKEADSHKMVAQLHGLATSRTNGAILAIGYSSDHTLRAHHVVYDDEFSKTLHFNLGQFFLAPVAEFIAYSGVDALERWVNAVAAVESINSLNLDYPRLGFSLVRASINSNSIYTTLAEAMGISPHKFANFIQVDIESSIYNRIQLSLDKCKQSLSSESTNLQALDVDLMQVQTSRAERQVRSSNPKAEIEERKSTLPVKEFSPKDSTANPSNITTNMHSQAVVN
jgi:hypothetical protein